MAPSEPGYETETNSWSAQKTLALICFLTGFLLSGIAIGIPILNGLYSTYGKRTLATVVSSSRWGGGSSRGTRSVKYRFVDESSVEHIGQQSRYFVPQGETILIEYLPSVPQINRVAGSGSQNSSPLETGIIFLAGFLFILVGHQAATGRMKLAAGATRFRTIHQNSNDHKSGAQTAGSRRIPQWRKVLSKILGFLLLAVLASGVFGFVMYKNVLEGRLLIYRNAAQYKPGIYTVVHLDYYGPSDFCTRGTIEGRPEIFCLKGVLPHSPQSLEDLRSMVPEGSQLSVLYNSQLKETKIAGQSIRVVKFSPTFADDQENSVKRLFIYFFGPFAFFLFFALIGISIMALSRERP